MPKKPKQSQQTVAKSSGSTTRSVSRPTIFAFVEQLNPKYFSGWTDDELKSVKDHDIQKMGSIIIKKLNKAGVKVVSGYAIQHLYDEKELWNTKTRDYVKCDVANHAHFLFKLTPQTAKPKEELAEIVGINLQQIERNRPGKYTWSNMLAYLIHIKYVENGKFLYSPADVVTLKGELYETIYAAKKEEWEKGRIVISKEKANSDLDMILEKMKKGKLTVNDMLIDSSRKYDNVLYAHYDQLRKSEELYSRINSDRREAIIMDRITKGDNFWKTNEYIEQKFPELAPLSVNNYAAAYGKTIGVSVQCKEEENRFILSPIGRHETILEIILKSPSAEEKEKQQANQENIMNK